MEYEIRIDAKQGTYVVAGSTDFEDILDKRDLVVGGLNIQYGEATDLFGWFEEPLLFCGFHDGNQAIFYLGQGDSDLFQEGAYYYDLTVVLSPNRIGKSYKERTFRDVFLKINNGVKYWK